MNKILYVVEDIKGFRKINGYTKSYEQNKKGLSYPYHKIIVQPDGINTKPLNTQI